MLKNKRILLILIIALALFLIPNVCNAAKITATETTKTSTGKTIKWEYKLEGDSIINLVCTNPSEISGTVTIPSTIDGHKVLTIADTLNGIFENCAGLSEVIIPDTVTKIGYRAFYKCVGLRKVTLSKNLVSIGNFAFDECGLNSITLPNGLLTIGSYAFSNCSGLKEITIPNSVTSIENGAFQGCTGLTSIVIPDNVTKLGAYAFQGCSGLTSVKLSNNITKLNEQVFSRCTGLTSIKIPESVTTICYGAFASCSNLTKVLIPDSIATIEKGAFDNCKKLTIFGNDNQVSKKYAEENNINFDYIANWDKVAEGADITPPILEKLEIIKGSGFSYDNGTKYYLVSVGTNISIKADFNEKVYGKTPPTLTIKCGNGDNIVINNGVIQGEYIIYTYRIQNKDKGIISAVSMVGGDIKDEAGNKVEKYTCPELVDDIWETYVFANGIGSVQGNQNNNQGNQNTNQQTVTLSSITITKAPTKTTYTVGESFNKSGMVVTATYSDGSKKVITNYTVSPSGALKTTDKKVTITYTENGVIKAAEQSITVKEKITINSNNKDDNNEKEDTNKDNTIKNDNKLPQTGITVISLAVISLLAVALISKVRYGKYKDI